MFSPDCNNQVSRRVYMETIAGWNDCGRAVFGDDGWARIFLAGLQGVARADCCPEFFAVEEDRRFGCERRAEVCSAWTAVGGRPHMDHLVHMGQIGLQRL